jgi:hypothetical protein
MTISTKIDMNHNRIARLQGLDDVARVLFPGNKTHQRMFLAIFVDLKWTKDQFLPALDPIADREGISHRTLETVRAKMRRLGIIDHVSRFNPKRGYREGWVFSARFERSVRTLLDQIAFARASLGPNQEKKDRDLQRYV